MMSKDADDPLKLRQKYPKNGLYRNDDQRELLWSVDWLAPREGIFLAEDGVHLIRWETWPHFPDRGHHLGREAVSFHANGKLLRSYRVNDLIDNPLALPHTERGYEWERRSEFQDVFTFKLTTHDGNVFTFDIRTGEMLSSHRPWRWLFGSGVIGLLCLGVVIWLARGWLGGRKPGREGQTAGNPPSGAFFSPRT